MSSRTPLTLIAFLVLAAAWCFPGTAAATVYCVDATPAELADNLAVDASCDAGQETIEAALTTAEGHAGPDSVLVGPGEFTLSPSSGPSKIEAFYSGSGENRLQLRGAGADLTHLTMGSTLETQKGLWVLAPAGSVVSDLRLTIPVNADGGGDTGLTLGGSAVGEDLVVDGPQATNATGVFLGNPAPSLRRSTVDLPVAASPTNAAVGATNGGTVTVLDSFLRGSTGIYTSGGATTVERTTVDAKQGSTTDSGAFFWRDSLIELGTRSGAVGIQGANFNNSNATIEGAVDGVTIVGGGSGSVGIRAMADSGQEGTTLTVANSIVEGPAKPLQVWADKGRTAALAVSFSNYDPATVQVVDNLDGKEEVGTATLQTSDVTALAPEFVDVAAGDFRLAASSPLLDAGDPAAPAAERRDLDGHARALLATCTAGAAPRRDLGAYERDPGCVEAPAQQPAAGEPAAAGSKPAPPQTTVRGPHRVSTAGATAAVSLRLGASEAGASFRCRVDRGPIRPCAKRLKLRLRPGRHQVRVQAIGAGGADPTPAKLTLRVLVKSPAKSTGVQNR